MSFCVVPKSQSNAPIQNAWVYISMSHEKSQTIVHWDMIQFIHFREHEHEITWYRVAS